MEQMRLISSEPRFLNLLDKFLKSQPRTLVMKDGLFEIGLGFGKDIMRFMRNRDVIVSTLGSILLSEAMLMVIGTAENG